MISIVTCFAPRGPAREWRHYVELIELQRKCTEFVGHRHVLVTDVPQGMSGELVGPLPTSLMRAIVCAQLLFLEQWDDKEPVVLADIDVLPIRPLEEAFSKTYGDFQMAVTNRDGNEKAPINNGAVYLAPGSRELALRVFHRTLDFCADHWGGDQEALALALAPVPTKEHGVFQRCGGRVAFLSMAMHNCTPQLEGVPHQRHPFVVHFKGTDRKPWMNTYARRFVLSGWHRDQMKNAIKRPKLIGG